MNYVIRVTNKTTNSLIGYVNWNSRPNALTDLQGARVFQGLNEVTSWKRAGETKTAVTSIPNAEIMPVPIHLALFSPYGQGI